MVSARAEVQRAKATSNPGVTSCTLYAGTDSDTAEALLGTQPAHVALASLHVTFVESVTQPTTARLVCSEDYQPGALVNGARITAVRVGAAHEG